MAELDPLDREEEEELAAWLPDTPFTFGPRCVLKRHLGQAWTVGPAADPRAAVVRAPWVPREPVAFGSSADDLWRLLSRLPGWTCVNLSMENAHRLRPVLEREMGVAARLYGDVYFVLDRPAVPLQHPSVRRLTEDDVELVERAAPPLRLAGYDSTLAALSGGIAAGAVVDRQLVATVSMATSSEEHGDVGAYTLEPWRNRGIASAAASLVAAEIQARGLRPVLSTGEDNARSMRVAEKVGFREFGREAYLIVPTLEKTEGFRPAEAPTSD